MANQYDSFLGTDDVPLTQPSGDERTLAILSHILTLVPGVGILAPIVIYIIKNRESQFVAYHSRESLNFQITIYIIAFILVITLVGIFLLWILGIVSAVFAIIATIRASENKLYRYPFSIRLVK